MPEARFDIHDFDEFFRQQFELLVRDVYFIVGDRERAMEVAQEALTRACIHWKKIHQYEKPGAWVRRVAIRISVRARNKFRREEPIQYDIVVPAVDQALMIDLRQAIAALPKDQRAAVILHYYDDLPIEEVAECLGIRVGTVKSRLFTARGTLRAQLER